MRRTRPFAHLLIGSLAVSLVGLEARAAGSQPYQPRWHTAEAVYSDSYVSFSSATLSGEGTPVVIGAFGGTASFPTGPNADDSIQVTVPTGSSLFVGGLNSEATRFTWLTEITGSGNYPTSILTMGQDTPTTNDDTILVAGTLFGAGATYFPVGPNSDDSIALPGTAFRMSSFVGALPPGEGYFAWVTHITGVDSVRVQSAALRPNGELMLVGNFDGSATFPTSSGQISVSAPGGTSGFVAQMARDDTGFEWVQPLPVRLGGAHTEVTVAGDDTPIIAGGFSGTMSFPTTPDDSIVLTTAFGTSKLFVAALNRDDSYIAWVQSIAGTSTNNYLTSVQAPQTGRTLLTGYFEGSLTVPTGPGDDSIVLSSNGASDMFVASLNSDDTYFGWVQGIGGSGADNAKASYLDADGALVLTGSIEDTVVFPAQSGSIDLTVAGLSDVFVAGMNPDDSSFAWAVLGGTEPSTYAGSESVTPSGDGRPLVLAYFGGVMNPPGMQPPVTLASPAGESGFFGTVSLASLPPDPDPPMPVPATPPAAARAIGGDQSAVVSWAAPASSGSYPVTYYLATSSPGGRTCLTSGLSCTVTGLSNGTAYTFTVQALTGAGWSVPSAPSNAVVPRPSAGPSIVITGSRDGGRIQVSGTTTGFGTGGELVPWVRLAGQSTYAAGSRTILVGMDGTFEWSRRSAKRASVYVATPSGDMRSNTVVVRGR